MSCNKYFHIFNMHFQYYRIKYLRYVLNIWLNVCILLTFGSFNLHLIYHYHFNYIVIYFTRYYLSDSFFFYFYSSAKSRINVTWKAHISQRVDLRIVRSGKKYVRITNRNESPLLGSRWRSKVNAHQPKTNHTQ